MNMPLVCTSKDIWAELSYEFGPSCLINLGRVGMGRVLCGPSWHGPSWFWAELSVIHIIYIPTPLCLVVSAKTDVSKTKKIRI